MNINSLFCKPCDKKQRETIIGSLLLRYPFISRETIGESLCSRPIDMLTIGNRKKTVLLTAAFHGMEWITSLILLKFSDELCMHIKNGENIYGINPASLLNRRGIAFIPCVNPDGVEIQINGAGSAGEYSSLVDKLSGGDTSHWQANARGVDINHNFDADWETVHKNEIACGITSPSPTKFGGDYPESEPETRAAASVCRAGNITHALAMHSQGREIYYGFGDSISPEWHRMALALSRVSGYKISSPEGIAVGGGFKDWFCQTLKRPGFTIEAGSGENPLPLSDFDSIYSELRELLTLSVIL